MDPFLSNLQKSCPGPDVLDLKVNAQVILLKNVSYIGGLVNGARGRVIAFVSQVHPPATSLSFACAELLIRISLNLEMLHIPSFDLVLEKNCTYTHLLSPSVLNTVLSVVTPEEWKTSYGGKKIASRRQLPLNLAWVIPIPLLHSTSSYIHNSHYQAISIHKSQGRALKKNCSLCWYVNVTMRTRYDTQQSGDGLEQGLSVWASLCGPFAC